jgi:hypothetical protein
MKLAKLFSMQHEMGRFFVAPVLVAIIVFAMSLTSLPAAQAQTEEGEFTEDFRLRDCRFKSEGTNPYFILRPGYRLILEGEEDGLKERLIITVLDQTKNISLPGFGTVRTRVVEEQHFADGKLVEIPKNFFAICDKTNDVYYFGETTDIFNPDGTVTHEGEWLAGVNGAKPGIVMPGMFLLGARYFQEQAPGVAMDRAEHVEMGLTVETEAGTFQERVFIVEASPLEPGATSEKTYCSGIGLVIDAPVELVKIVRRKAD